MDRPQNEEPPVDRMVPLTAMLLVCAGVFAAAPAAAQRAAADTSMVTIAPGGPSLFVAWPAGSRPAPAVIVVHEWWGLNAQIRRVARQLARQGYVAVVPDLYRGQVAGDAEGAHVLSRGLEDESALADLDATAAWLAAEPRTRGARVGVLGFCMGGRLAQMMGARSDRVSAVVIFYGRPLTDPEDVARLRAPLMGHFGSADRGIPTDRVTRLDEALREAGKDAQIFVYQGAGHAFMNDERDSFHPDASRQAWARTLAFLDRHLKR
jgi:carboxymethylenebutenolidase